jgi:MerR family transcriptional regulator, mercuric resistance operon regulatory protein
METELRNLTIGAFANAGGVNVETIRFYQRRGLLAEPDRPYGGVRSLDEVAQLLKLEDGTHCSEAAELATARLTDVRARLADLMRMESALSNLVSECDRQQGNVSCPLIASLHCG